MTRYRLAPLVLVTLAISACGTFQLAGGIYPPPGKTVDQQQTDTLVCKDQAKNEANTAGRQAGAFLLGLTIVGVPVAYEMEKSKQREVFSDCMTARGYRITSEAVANQSVQPTAPTLAREAAIRPSVPTADSQVATQPIGSTSAPSTAPRDEAGQLQKLKELRDKGLITEDEHNAKRKAIVDRL